jgi:hypothetical protein
MLPAPARGLLHLQQHLQGATLARGLNIGPTWMAESCSLSYRQLAGATEWCPATPRSRPP